MFTPYTGSTPFGVRTFFEYKEVQDEIKASGMRRSAWEQKQRNLLTKKLGIRVHPKFETCQKASDYIDKIKPLAHPKMLFSIPETAGSLALF